MAAAAIRPGRTRGGFAVIGADLLAVAAVYTLHLLRATGRAAIPGTAPETAE